MNAAQQLNPSILSEDQLKVMAATLAPYIGKLLVPEQPLRMDKLAQHLDCSEKHIMALAKRGIIREHRFDDGGIPYYFASEVNEDLKKRTLKRRKL
jgi:predicted transcriptional regulator